VQKQVLKRYNKSMDDKKSYKEIEQELQKVLGRVENESYDDLDDLLKDYDSGIMLIASLQDKLEKAKNSIKKVK
jgi:exonuclease VII small subunit